MDVVQVSGNLFSADSEFWLPKWYIVAFDLGQMMYCTIHSLSIPCNYIKVNLYKYKYK